MKFFYQFKNLLGTVYRKGDLAFSNDGNTVISPVGNRISLFDLKNNKCLTLPVESKFNYTALDLSPNGQLLICVNEVGEAHLISMISLTIVHRHAFKTKVPCLKFSPNGRYLAVCRGTTVLVFRSPGLHLGEFNPFVIKHVFQGSYDDTCCLCWSDDSRFLSAGSKDGTTKIFAVESLQNFQICSLGCHSDSIVHLFFEENSLNINTISRDGRLFFWEANKKLSDFISLNEDNARPEKERRVGPTEDNEVIDESRGEKITPLKDTNDQSSVQKGTLQYSIKKKVVLMEAGMITTASFNKNINMLATGYLDGSFKLHEIPLMNEIHSLKVIDTPISKILLNSTGDWIAIASEDRGKLIVWEWQSETYIMKQQGHSSLISSLAYSPDGLYIVTGGEDGKVKLWNTQSGFCFITFSSHTSGVTAVTFSSNGKVFLSASVDGSVRAYDMTRYRNFRTLTSTKPVQFCCVCIDMSGEFVAAGAQDVFEIHLWSMKLGRLLEILSGHVGPVVGLAFSPNYASTELASVSWDKTLRVWNGVETSFNNEVIQLYSEGLAVAYSPNGKELVVSTHDGQLLFFDPKDAKEKGSIQGRNDLGSGRAEADLIKPKTKLKAKAFNSVCYSADGNYIIAGGKSKNVCIYNVENYLLVKKFEITQNHSFDALDDFIHKKQMTEFGVKSLVEDREQGLAVVKLPGVKKGDMAERKTKPEVRVISLKFSPNGKEWTAATTEGILMYSLEHNRIFNPFDLEEDITPKIILKTLKKKLYSEALVKALKLNEDYIIHQVLENVPSDHIQLCIESMKQEVYFEKLLHFLSKNIESSHHLEFYLMWLKSLLRCSNACNVPYLILLQKCINKLNQDLSKMCEFNKYSIQYFLKKGEVNNNKIENCVEDINSEMDF